MCIESVVHYCHDIYASKVVLKTEIKLQEKKTVKTSLLHTSVDFSYDFFFRFPFLHKLRIFIE